MKNIIFLILLFPTILLGQNDIEANFKKIYSEGKYHEIISAKPNEFWNAKAY